ncbi:Histone-lysine N-methyltransferase, H3 lysine-4 specific [Grifola frondosa]|uniref:Histone-lysine N-methyltransferase, H3 lysine-4 specific n=1 Tax=Grifola frondosa TaxID=5627 RepID=A0A1C7MID4_GRIFR|nr:Histone-lysine N-methyltransferase, H3 lysine-4 specific [Grifola frondosa]
MRCCPATSPLACYATVSTDERASADTSGAHATASTNCTSRSPFPSACRAMFATAASSDRSQSACIANVFGATCTSSKASVAPEILSPSSPPPWPPAQSEFPEGKNYRVLFDHAIDKDRDGQIRLLIEKLRELGADQGKEPRVKGKGKGKEVLLRYEGEEAKVRRLPTLRPARTEFVVAKYEYDANSTGPPPPTSVLILGVSPLTANHHLRRHFQAHGTIASFEPQIDKANGGALGIVFIKYSSHEEAQRCVEKEHGKRLALGIGGSDGEEIKVVFDGEGKKLKAVMAELDERRRQEREEKKRKEKEKLKEANSVLAKSTPSTSASQTPAQGVNPWRNNLLRQPQQGLRAPPHAHLPMRPQGSHSLSNSPMPHGASPHPNGNVNGPRGLPTAPARVRRPPAALVRARIMSSKAAPPTGHIRPPMHYPQSFSAVPSHPRGLRSELLLEDRDVPSPFPPSRSPSPIARRPGQSLRNARLKEHEAVVEELAKNGFEHVTIEGHGAQLSGAIREEDVRQFFVGFKLDKILRDSSGWFVTFQTGDSARRAAMVLSSGARTLAHHSVHVSVHAPPALPSSAVKVRWDDAELVEQAEKIILKDLWAMLEKDVMDRVVGSEVRRLVSDDKAKRVSKISGILEERIDGHNVEVPDAAEPKPYDRAGLKGLSFRKQKKRIREETKAVTPPAMAVEHEIPEEAEVERPKKKPKKSIPKKVVEVEDIESEDEDDMVAAVIAANDISRKRAMSEVSEVEEPVKKKAKTQLEDDKEPILSVQMKKAKKPTKKSTKAIVEEVVHKVLPDELDFEVPVVAQVRVTPGYESSLSPPASPMLIPKISVHLAPPLDPIAEGICQDDEDLYFAKLALSRMLFGEAATPRPPSPGLGVPPPLREHKTGSARTEGYYKISHAEKSAYVAQYASRTQVDEVTPEIEAPQPTITSSRSNRANARRRAQGLEEMNQVQRAMALSKGESATTDSVKFNQQTRKKPSALRSLADP